MSIASSVLLSSYQRGARSALRRSARSRTLFGSVHDAADHRLELGEDLRFSDMQHPPTELSELGIPGGIVMLAPLVICAIDFDHEPRLWAREVNDAMADDELPAKRETRFRPGEHTPQERFRACWSKAHATSACFEDAGLSRSDTIPSKHDNLRASGARARRAKGIRADGVTRARRGAARHVRGRSAARSGVLDGCRVGRVCDARSSRPPSALVAAARTHASAAVCWTALRLAAAAQTHRRLHDVGVRIAAHRLTERAAQPTRAQERSC